MKSVAQGIYSKGFKCIKLIIMCFNAFHNKCCLPPVELTVSYLGCNII